MQCETETLNSEKLDKPDVWWAVRLRRSGGSAERLGFEGGMVGSRVAEQQHLGSIWVLCRLEKHGWGWAKQTFKEHSQELELANFWFPKEGQDREKPSGSRKPVLYSRSFSHWVC